MEVVKQLEHWSAMARLTSSQESILSADQLDAIAEAFRALEQENTLLKQGCENDPLVHEVLDWKERAEAAESWVKTAERTMDHQANVITQLGVKAEAAEEDNLRLKSVINTEANRAEAAEAKLAELEKQEPVGFYRRGKDKGFYLSTINTPRPGCVPLFRRPAPAVSLAELVPCPYPCGWKNLLSISMADAAFLARGLIEGEPVSEGQRASVVLNNDRLITVLTAMLRNIEEAK